MPSLPSGLLRHQLDVDQRARLQHRNHSRPVATGNPEDGSSSGQGARGRERRNLSTHAELPFPRVLWGGQARAVEQKQTLDPFMAMRSNRF